MATTSTRKKSTSTKKTNATEKVETPKPEVKKEPEVKKKRSIFDNWVIKDRTYRLKNNKSPVTKTILSRGIYWFDEDKGYEREIKYTINQKTPFVDMMQGPQRLGHIKFKDGMLFVPKEKTVLQWILSILHPDLNKTYVEVDKEAEAQEDLDMIDMEYEALTLANELDIDTLEAIVRVEIGSDVNELSSKELRRDAKVFAKTKPKLFIELAKDENVQLRNVGIKAAEQGIISLSQDQRTFTWVSTGKKLMTVPFDENPYSALAAWFKTDEGVDVYRSIEKRL